MTLTCISNDVSVTRFTQWCLCVYQLTQASFLQINQIYKTKDEQNITGNHKSSRYKDLCKENEIDEKIVSIKSQLR